MFLDNLSMTLHFNIELHLIYVRVTKAVYTLTNIFSNNLVAKRLATKASH